MDFDDEMSGLQIEDLGEYFLQADIGDSWKGFSLGYVEEEKVAGVPPTSSSAQVPRQSFSSNSSRSSAQATASHAAASQAMRFGTTAAASTANSAPIAIPHNNTQSRPQEFASPPMSSFSELLKHGGGFSLGSPRNDFTFSPAMFASAANMLKSGVDSSRMNDDPMDLSNFSLDALKRLPPQSQSQGPSQAQSQSHTPISMQQTPKAVVSTPTTVAIKPSPAKTPTSICQNILGTQEQRTASQHASGAAAVSESFASTAKRPFEEVEPCSMDSCSTIAQPEDDRGYRKKSREKMRRQEVNVKFDELIDLLGLSNRVRKSAILQEAVAAIKALKRDRDDMRRERDRLQHEVSKLATCLQYSHLGSVAAASAMSMAQVPNNQQLAQLNSSNASLLAGMPPGSLQVPSGFQLGASGFANFQASSSSATGSSTSSLTSVATTPTTATAKVPIAPRTLKPVAPAVSPFTTSGSSNASMQ